MDKKVLLQVLERLSFDIGLASEIESGSDGRKEVVDNAVHMSKGLTQLLKAFK